MATYIFARLNQLTTYLNLEELNIYLVDVVEPKFDIDYEKYYDILDI